jgi:IclR family transcriptional regulator, acetate operon repressor
MAITKPLCQPDATCSELAPRLATVLGPNSSVRLESLDVTIQHFLDHHESPR